MSENQPLMLGSVVLVCQNAGASVFSDDLKDSCADCGRMLSFRPYLEAESPKLCSECFGVRKDAARANCSGYDC